MNTPGERRRNLGPTEKAERAYEMNRYLEFAREKGLDANDRRTAERFARENRDIEPGFTGSWHQPQHRGR